MMAAGRVCLQMFADGAKAVGGEGRMQTLDVAELLEQAVSRRRPPHPPHCWALARRSGVFP
ncbi:MAG TPA: hypothetical protein VFE37_31225 [Chloroflexota bacterium]|nr:hypothetical protein [Chloroflexota bacterium]